MGKKDKAKKKKGIGKEKTELKTERNAKKKALKSQEGPKEDPIEAMIARFKAKDEMKVSITEEPLKGNPGPRLNCSFIMNPSKPNEILIFGGEYFDGEETLVYNDLFRYSIDKKEWRQISSPNTPGPRCSHQAVVYKNWMYLFAGEFTSPSQNQFYHYKDMWRLNCDTMAWENMKDIKASPSGRSGHRMVRWKNYIILFGGFYDTLSETKYFNDLHFFDLETGKWRKIEFKYLDAQPNPRSGFGMAIYENTLFLYGGYSKEKAVSKYSEAKGIVHTDMWSMNLSSYPNNLVWEKVKKSGIAPSGRSGMGMVTIQKKLYFFGGASDVEEKDDIKSVFYDQLYSYHMDNRRWFPVTLQKKKTANEKRRRAKKDNTNQSNKAVISSPTIQEKEEEEEEYNEEEEYYDEYQESNLNASFEKLKMEPPKKEEKTEEKEKGKGEEEGEKGGEKEKVESLYPSPRINCQMAVNGNVLYLYGGLFETEKREVTYNDLYSLALNRMDGFECVIPSDDLPWKGEISDDEEEDEEEEGEDDEDDEEEEDDEESEEENTKEGKEEEEEEDEEDDEKTETKEEKKKNSKPKVKEGKSKVKKRHIEELKDRLAQYAKDEMPTPNPKESLREFFDRTKEFWTRFAFEKIQSEGSMETDEKALKTTGFACCEERFKEVRPLMDEFEQIEAEEYALAQEKKKEKEKQKSKRLK